MEDIILLNDLEGCTFYELYAGGSGASIKLLLSNICKNIVLNDLDFHIYAFWHSVINDTENLIKLINDVQVNVENWQIQNDIYKNFREYDILKVGFSAFFLNRSNRSGILYKAGPIGGKDQTGKYKINVRFNKPDLIKRIEKIAQYKDKIEIHNEESISLLDTVFKNNVRNKFVFLDPPYYVQGERLYLNFYNDEDHVTLRDILKSNVNASWLLTYDNCERINELYADFRKSYPEMSYTLQAKRKSKEVMVFSDNLNLPRQYRAGSKSIQLNLVRP
ncbi:MAG: DNA adenine methylase [Anaerolineales bacterium]|nr:DNA adenine methylase [Anaerolineales bacterium]